MEEFNMWKNWKRLMSGAFMLTSISLLLFGCGNYTAAPTATTTNTKALTGYASGPDGLPVAYAKVTAYAVDSSGVQSTTPLSVNPANSVSAADGSYVVNIPASYSGNVILEAVPPLSVAKVANYIAKLVSASATDTTIRSAIPSSSISQAVIPPVMINPATNLVVIFIQQNTSTLGTSGFSTGNIQQATFVLGTIFGANFTQIPPPKNGADSSASNDQLNLLVSIQAFTKISNTVSPQQLVISLTSSTGLGAVAVTGQTGSISDLLKSTIAATTSLLQTAGTLPAEYQPSVAIITGISNANSNQLTGAASVLTDNTAPSVPTGLAIPSSSILAKVVTLNWSPSTDNSGGSGLAGYAIYRSTASSPYVSINTVGPNATGFSDLTVKPGTTYSYKMKAFDNAGNTSGFSDATPVVTTPTLANAADTAPPSAPILSIKGSSYSQVNLLWSQSTKISSDGTIVPAAGYNVFRNGQIVATTTDTSYVDTTVAANTDYLYYVKAFDANSNFSVASNLLNITTPNSPTATPPAAPTLLTASGNDGSISLAWIASASATADMPVVYSIYRGSAKIASGIQALSYRDSTALPGTTYTYTVTAVYQTPTATLAGESVPSNQASFILTGVITGTAPPVPTNLVLSTATTSSSVALSWGASTGSSGYDVLRSVSGGAAIVIATVVKPGFTDTSVLPSTTYSYTIQAFSSSGVHSASSAALLVATKSAVTFLNDTTPPTAPTNLVLVSAAKNNAVALSWAASTKSTGDKIVAGYRIYRNGAQVADISGASSTSYSDTSVSGSTAYTYTVKAYDNPGNLSDASNQLSVTTPISVPNTYGIVGTITRNSNGIAGVLVTLALGNDYNDSAVTDSNGNYYFSNKSNGSYTVTPSLAGYAFNPSSLAVTLNSANAVVSPITASLSGSVIGGTSYPNGTIIGGITYPTGTVINGVTYPTATVIGGTSYPNGTIIGGITYPTGTVINGVTYPTATVIGGVTYPTGSVTGGTTFPSGVVIGGVAYPSGTVVGGVAFPVGTVSGCVAYPSGSLLGSLSWSNIIVSGKVTLNGTGLSGVTVALSNGAISTLGSIVSGLAITDSSGNYAFLTSILGGSYYITPSLPGYTFAPGSLSLLVPSGSASVTTNNFAATASP